MEPAVTQHDETLARAGYGPYLRTREVAQALNIRRETVSRLVQDGKLHATRLNRELRIPRVELARFLALGDT